MRTLLKKLAPWWLLAQTLGAFDVHAQETSIDLATRTVFPASFYADGEPVTALDVVNRTPGFAFDRGNTQLRGLEGVVGNVLIDGRWPTTKALSLQDTLLGIPYSTIERAEIIRAGTPGFDMRGHRVVLNVVRKTEGSSALTVEAATMAYFDNDRATGGTGRLEYAKNTERSGFDAGLVYKSEQFRFVPGEGQFSRSGVGVSAPIEGRFDADDWQRSLQATVNSSYSLAGVDVALNLTATDSRMLIDQVGDYRTALGDPFSEIVDIARDTDVFEVGGDLKAALSTSQRVNLKLLHRTESEESDSRLGIQDVEILADDAFDWSESVLRAMLQWDIARPVSVEFGVEAAFNELDSVVEVQIDGVQLALPNANIRVEEDRYQGFAKATVRLRPRWLLEVATDYETSKLTQSGDANLSKRFHYIKPRLTLSWEANSATDVRIRLENVVGQLGFNSFAASPSLESGIISGGNANLEPEESDEYELQVERRFWGEGSAIFTYVHAKLKNALDFIPVGSGFDALGNAGEATRDSLHLDLNLPFDRLGWRGATFRTRISYFDSEITDPFTGEARVISGRDGLTGFLGFTQELPGLRSVIGFDGFWGFEDRAFRISEARVEREYPVPLSLWWDRTLGQNLVLRIEVAKAWYQRRKRERQIYGQGRGNGPVTVIETRRTVQDPHLMVRLRKRF